MAEAELASLASEMVLGRPGGGRTAQVTADGMLTVMRREWGEDAQIEVIVHSPYACPKILPSRESCPMRSPEGTTCPIHLREMLPIVLDVETKVKPATSIDAVAVAMRVR